MTDRSRDPGRIDLRAIDEPSDSAQADRVIAAALARAAGESAAPSDVLSSIETLTRPLLALAATLLVTAFGTLLLTRGRAIAEPATVVANWAEQSHVPTNGELLATFQGYGR
jgi:hypothetical protein